MSLPRQILPGATYHISRRCTQRQFLLRPCSIVNAIFLYILAWAAARYGILIHSFYVASNHYHLVLTDPFGLLPRFMEDLNKFTAKCLNASYGRWENFWAPGSYSCQRCVTPEDTLRSMVYDVANPVEDGLVQTAGEWPGLISLPHHHDGSAWNAARPDIFFREDGPMPAEVSLVLARPPGFEHLSQEEFISLFEDRLREEEAKAFAKHNGRFLGLTRIRRFKHTDSPDTIEPRRTRNPRISARDTATRIHAIHEHHRFQREYRAAWLQWRDGDVTAVFPPGTWWMLHYSPAHVAKPPDLPRPN